METLKTAVAKIREENEICLQIMNSPFFRFSFIWKLLAHLSLWPRESKEFSSISNQDEGQQEADTGSVKRFSKQEADKLLSCPSNRATAQKMPSIITCSILWNLTLLFRFNQSEN